MENQTAAEEASSVVKKRKIEVAELVTSTVLLVQLNNNKKPRGRVVTANNIGRRECSADVSVVEAKEEDVDDDDTVCASPRSSGGSDHVNDDDESSCCSSNGSSELVEDGNNNLKLVDLKDERDDDESDEVESLTYNPLRERRQMTTSTNNLQPQPTPAEPRRGSTAEKMPSELELEEFFTAAEKDIKDKFAKKYNYDITKDEPLEGRYEWTGLKP